MLPYLPNQINVSTTITMNVFNAIRKKQKSQLIWILQTYDNEFDNNFADIEIHNFQQYDNACEIIKQTKPDVIFVDLSYAYSSYPLIIAGKFMKVPVVGYLLYGKEYLDFSINYSRFKIFYSKISRFFSKEIESNSKKKFIGRGRFYLRKYYFLFKTLIATKASVPTLIFNIIENFWINTIGIMDRKFDTRLAVDAICLNNDSWINPLMQAGFDRKSLRITGTPLYDEYKINLIPKRNQNVTFPIRVLFITSPLYSHGQWSKKQQQDFVERIVLELNKSTNIINFAIKIHPSSESIEFYNEVLQKTGTSVPVFQHEKLSELLRNFDIAISFGRFSTSHLDVLFSGIPLIIINESYMSDEIFVLKHNVALECSSISSLVQKIKSSINFLPKSENLTNFCNVFSSPLDGLAADRIASIILEISQKKH